MKKITILLILFTSFLYSQNVMTKFIKKGTLNDIQTNQLHKFKKNDVVFLIKRLDKNRWQVNTNGYTGFVTSPYLKLTDDIIATIEQYELKEKREEEHLYQEEISITRSYASNQQEEIKTPYGLTEKQHQRALKTMYEANWRDVEIVAAQRFEYYFYRSQLDKTARKYIPKVTSVRMPSGNSILVHSYPKKSEMRWRIIFKVNGGEIQNRLFNNKLKIIY